VVHVGSRVRRPDDPRILTGRGRYVDVDALVPFGAMLTEQPMTPQRVLRALGRLPRA
jgi:hypothetical protein